MGVLERVTVTSAVPGYGVAADSLPSLVATGPSSVTRGRPGRRDNTSGHGSADEKSPDRHFLGLT